MTDSNGLLYMRARYYSPVLKRFVNADIIAGVITDPVTLNRYAYANGNPVSNIDPFGLTAERSGTHISNAPIRPTEITYDILNQILKLSNRDLTKYYYDEDYANKAVIEIDKNGNITYIFYNYYNGFTHDSFMKTEYYFEVKKASYWQSKLDYERKNILDNEILNKLLGSMGDLNPPGANLSPQAEAILNTGEFIYTFGLDIFIDTIDHKTKLSEYLFDKVATKNPDENVAVLKSATTYKGDKYFWEDELELEKIIERVFF